MITIQLLGGASLRSGDAPLAGPPAQRHRVALLSLAVAAWPQPLARDRAMAFLWPEKDLASARRLLNLAVHVLRGALGDGALASAGDGLLLDPTRVRCDWHELRAAIAAHDHERVVLLHRGVLMDGFHLAESAEFGQWLAERRTELALAYTESLRAVADSQARAGDLQGRAATLRRLVAADPYSGTHALALMRALDAAGDRAGAIQHAALHARRLRLELDIDADPQVAALAERLRRAAVPSARGTDGAAPAPVVAVLPFTQMGADAAHDWFADGLTEDVIAQLARLRSLSVIARASVAPFRDRRRSPREIGATLGAGWILDGSVRHAGDRVRIVATLLEAESEHPRWSETWDRELTDIFSIQADVALRIADGLRAGLSGDERARLRREPTTDVAAYRYFLRGRQSFVRYTPASLTEAIGFFERAVARDPAYALAWAHLAMAHLEQLEQGGPTPAGALERAAAAAERALALDPELGEAHGAAGHLALLGALDPPTAERHFQRAIALNPGSAAPYELFGRLCSSTGRHDEGIALQRRALALDPLVHHIDLVTALLRAERWDEARTRALEIVEFDPDDARARATLGWACFLGGDRERGLAHLERAASHAGGREPPHTAWLGQLGEAHGLAGNGERARDILRSLEERAGREFVSPYHLAYLHVGLGEPERAIDCLERAVAQRSGGVYGIAGSFLFAPLRGHPRFDRLVAPISRGAPLVTAPGERAVAAHAT